jgi:hypothetical protein
MVILMIILFDCFFISFPNTDYFTWSF